MKRAGLALLLLLVACEARGNPLVGRWQDVDREVVVEFSDGGRMTVTVDQKPLGGTWSSADNRLTMTLGEQPTLTCLWQIAGETLTIEPGDAKCGRTSFRRLP